MTTPLCPSCGEGPKGERGHDALAFYVDGPYPGQQIFRCNKCDGRWIRHYGSTAERFAWTRFSEEYRTHVARPGSPNPKTRS
jgi:hypothetical protein